MARTRTMVGPGRGPQAQTRSPAGRPRLTTEEEEESEAASYYDQWVSKRQRAWVVEDDAGGFHLAAVLCVA